VRQNWTLAQLRAGKPTVGLWLQSHNFHIARAIAAQGLLDWMTVDMEHTPVDLSTMSMMCSAITDISAGKCTPLVRLAHGTQFYVKQALDSGAQGIIVPMVNTVEDARDVVRFARFPPAGERGGGGAFPHYGFGTTSYLEYVQNANQEIMVAIQIETREAAENIESILDVPGLDLIFIGPFDLHLSLGLSPSMWSDQPEFQAAAQRVMRTCEQRGMPYGTLASNGEGAQARLKDGFTFVGIGTDMTLMMGALHSNFKQAKSAQ
jgi:4-hydroxy-2-oxoheptanedioate aldolase